MEVHKHPHHPMQKKHYLEYVVEFLMIFLAVFLGFEAENIREHSLERHREKQYIQSLINDLKTDTTKLGSNIVRFQKMLIKQDTLIKSYPLLRKGFNQTFYRNYPSIRSFPDFIYTDATIQQLKNSGGFRLIKNHNAIDSIMAYDALVVVALIDEAGLRRTVETAEQLSGVIINFQGYNTKKQHGITNKQLEATKFDYLLTHDKISLSNYYSKVLTCNSFTAIVMRDMMNVNIKASQLIRFLQTAYDLESE